MWGRLGLAQMLLEQDADVNARAKNGSIPLHCAVGPGLDLGRMLLKHNASVNARRKNDWTPLH